MGAFAHPTPVVRERRPQVPDPRNPGRTIPGRWEDAEQLTIHDCSVQSSSATALRNADRNQALESKSLYCGDPDADVRRGDRIRVGDIVYEVRVRPQADKNPFTGWRPPVEIPLEHSEG